MWLVCLLVTLTN